MDSYSLPLVTEQIDDMLWVVRDDLLDGGSKTRFLPYLIGNADELVFGGPFCGGAPLALSVIGKQYGRKVTLFYAARKTLHPRQLEAVRNGATIKEVGPFGFMSNVQAKARRYCEETGALFLPLGFDVPEASKPFIEVMREVRTRLGFFDQVWCAAGSGMLARCLGVAFPDSAIMACAVGLKSRHDNQSLTNNVTIHVSPYEFKQECKTECPFPCCPNYDRKAWEMMLDKRSGRVLFWNVMA